MTSDRLRQAADRLEQPEWRRTTLTAIEQNRSTAALLRAVAIFHNTPCWQSNLGRPCNPGCVRCQAEALADVILGTTDE